jgi:hypothetical protein
VPALVFSFVAHLGLISAFGIGSGPLNNSAPNNRSPVNAFTVHFTKTDGIATQVDSNAGKISMAAEKSLEPVIDQPQFAQQRTEEEPLLPIFGQFEPHYFRPQELTGKPFILHDVSPDLALTLYGVPLQMVVLRLLVNEEGAIDRIVVEDSELPEQSEHSVTEAFSKLKFYPGKIGEIAVKTQLKIVVEINDASTAESL